jgi:hypothetical protein
MIDYERLAVKVQSRADYEKEVEAAEAAKIVLPPSPALGSAAACARFLGKIGLIGASLEAAAQANEHVLPNLISAGFRIPLHKLNEALAKTTLDTYGRIVVKNRLSAVGLID